jgi:preprotein translocase subunit SecA
MTGTAAEASNELWHIYRLPVVKIPHNRPCVRQDYRLRIFADRNFKWDAIVEEIKEIHACERPILVGTRSVADSELLAERLQEAGLKFHLLNAVRHETEAEIISHAGLRSNITIATNMAGRGADIQLDEGVAELGGLHVIMCEPHESSRIDRQLFGRSGRQGDPGSAQPFASLDDELVRRFVNKKILQSLKSSLNQNVPGAGSASSAIIRLAQALAQRQSYRQRQSVMRADTWLEDSLSFTNPS